MTFQNRFRSRLRVDCAGVPNEVPSLCLVCCVCFVVYREEEMRFEGKRKLSSHSGGSGASLPDEWGRGTDDCGFLLGTHRMCALRTTEVASR